MKTADVQKRLVNGRAPSEADNARVKRGQAFEWLADQMRHGDDEEIARGIAELAERHREYVAARASELQSVAIRR